MQQIAWLQQLKFAKWKKVILYIQQLGRVPQDNVGHIVQL